MTPATTEQNRMSRLRSDIRKDAGQQERPHATAGPRFNGVERFFFVLVAICFDIVQLLLDFIGMGFVITPVAGLTTYIWLEAKGLSFTASLKKGGSLLKNPGAINVGSMLVGLIPIAGGIIPERTAGAIAIVVNDYAQGTRSRLHRPAAA